LKGIPLIQTNDPALIARGYNLGLKLVPNLLQVMTVEQLERFEQNLPELRILAKEICEDVPTGMAEISEVRVPVPSLTSTGPTVADWFSGREDFHRFFTGERIILRDMFSVTDEILSRTDLIPVFRPADATNRMAVRWKQKLGITIWEEVDVMRYKNSAGPGVPELYFINRSVRPDEDTLGKNAKTPDELIVAPEKIWCDLYVWCDADSLYFKIMNEHLDSETWTWFPHDRLPDGGVACGSWNPSGGRVRLVWYGRDNRNPGVGARVAIPVSLRS
jgi:hypothetical protein